jgi:hypothetical protein
MKTTIRLASFLLIFLSASHILAGQGKSTKGKAPKEKKQDKIVLFNGKDLSNWVFMLKDPSVDPATVFTVQEGLIHIKGEPFGYMRTKDIYSNYQLHLEYRYPFEATNSGIFIHAQLPDTIWPRCVECQLQAGNAGDFVLMNGADMKERIDKSKRVVKKLTESNEKPVGQWNTMNIKCTGNTIEVEVNGTIQNMGSNINLSQGSICLQSEGKDIEFRNIIIKKLKK